MTTYCFVVDAEDRPLSPTKEVKAWYLIRKSKATLISKYPMVIRLRRIVKNDRNTFICGIDDGSKHVGIAITQPCSSYNKVVFKGTIEQRNDVKKLMDTRRAHRRYRRFYKRYREPRFNNRASSKRTGRLAPSIKQKKDAILRVIDQLNKWIMIQEFHLEDVMIDIRAIADGYKPYPFQYQHSNRLDENIRRAVILRDDFKCMECGKKGCSFEVHHIKAKRYGGGNGLNNLITLCLECHQKTKEKEKLFESRYASMIDGKCIRLDYAQHVMQGKTYLRNKLSERGRLYLTNGGETANKRIDWNIDKSHCNDAVVICGLKTNIYDVKEWLIKPMRRKSKARTDYVLGIRHRDLVSYKYKNGNEYIGYVTALYPKQNTLNFQSKTKHCKRVNAKKCKLLWRYNKIYWLECV